MDNHIWLEWRFLTTLSMALCITVVSSLLTHWRYCSPTLSHLQHIPRNMHTVFALLYFVVVIHWLIFPYPSGLLHWHCGNLTIAPVPVKQPWWIWINTSCEFIMNDCITTTKQSTTKPCTYFLGYTVSVHKRGPDRLHYSKWSSLHTKSGHRTWSFRTYMDWVGSKILHK